MTAPLRLLPYGAAAILVETEPDLVPILTVALTAGIAAGNGPDVVDVVPAERTVLVRVRPGADLVELRRYLHGLNLERIDSGNGPHEVVTVPVVYDGADLDEVARLTGLRTEEVIAAHARTEWTVAFCGFAPGFAYLVGGDPRLNVARRASPRARVPRGAVALAGRYSAVYPGASPGGWQLIGRTDAPVWDLERDPPALLRPGVRVRFVATSEIAPGAASEPAPAALSDSIPAAASETPSTIIPDAAAESPG